MAFHHHNHHYHHHQLQQQQQNNYPTCNNCCCSSPPPSLHHPSPPSQSHHYSTDPLLIQSIVTQILQSSPNPQFIQPPKQQQQHRKDEDYYHHHHHQQQQEQEKQTRSLLRSLHRRIDALETSLHHLSSSPSFSTRPFSLRDLAARTIQTHFRAFLVRRSRTLRYLKDLAFIKSSFNSLKASLSSNPHLDHVALSQKAMDLLLKLDSVQGGDPMIRDGKRSISRELVKFLEFVDGISVKRQQISSRAVKNVRLNPENNRESRVFISSGNLGGNHRVFLNKLNHQAQEIQGSYRLIEEEEEDESQGELEDLIPVNDQEENPRNLNYQKSEHFQTQDGILVKRPDGSFKSKKSVRFADNGKVSRVFISTQDSDSDVVSISDIGVVSNDDQRELVENLCKEVEEIGGFSSRVSEDDEEEEEFENKGPPTQFSNGERNTREYVETEVSYPGISRHFHSQNGKFAFSAPVPVKMESRVEEELMKRRNNQRVMR